MIILLLLLYLTLIFIKGTRDLFIQQNSPEIIALVLWGILIEIQLMF